MQSLRTRRPSDGKNPSKQPQQTQKLSKTPSRRAGGNARKSRVDDKIKKRMSMRYADISAPTGALVPDMPAMPIGMVNMGARRAASGESGMAGVGTAGMGLSIGMSRIGEEEEFVREPAEGNLRDSTRGADLKDLQRESFDPDACGFFSLPPFPPSFVLLEMFTFCVIDLKAKMANSTEAEIRSLQSYLLALREDTNSDLRKNVFKKCVPLYLHFFLWCTD